MNRLSMHQNVSKIVRDLRTAMNMTQQDLANAAGVCLLTAFRWDNGLVKPNRTNIAKLAEIFQISPKRLKSLLEESRNG